jgi:hypothetical protein
MKKIAQSSRLSRAGFLRTVALSLPLWPALASAQSSIAAAPSNANLDLGNLRAFVELARSDLRTQKAFVVAQNIDFTEDEAVEFWPMHREYETELNELMDRRYQLILQFAKQAGAMTDAQARTLANQVFDLESKRTNLKRKHFKKFCKVIPPLKATRFFQIENQLNMVIDLQVASALPLIK